MNSQAPAAEPSLPFGAELTRCPGSNNAADQCIPFCCKPRKLFAKAKCGFPLKDVAACPICRAYQKKAQKSSLVVRENDKMYALNVERDQGDGKGWIREFRIIVRGRVAIEKTISHMFDTSDGMMRLSVDCDRVLDLEELRQNEVGRRKRWGFCKRR